MADKKTAAKKTTERKKPVHVPGGQRLTLHKEDGRKLQLILTPSKGRFYARAVEQTPNGNKSEKGKPLYDRATRANKGSDTLKEAQDAFQSFINDAGGKGWSSKAGGAPLHDFSEIPE